MFLRSQYFQNHFLRNVLSLNFDLNSFEHFASLFQKMASILPIKNFQKTKYCYFQTPTIIVLEFKEAPKAFSKKVPLTKFWFKQFFMFSLTFPENAFNFVTQKLQKTENFPFQMAKTFVFDLKVASKPFSKKLPITDFWLNCFWKLWLAFPESISISSPKNLQKT